MEGRYFHNIIPIMEVFTGLDIGAYSFFRFTGLSHPNWRPVALLGHLIGTWGVLVLVFIYVGLAIRARRAIPWGSLLRLGAIGLSFVLLRIGLDRPRPEDSQDFFGVVVGGSFPNSPVFWTTLFVFLILDTLPQTQRRRVVIPALGLVLWVVLSEFFLHLGFLTDHIAALAAALGIGFLAPRFGIALRTHGLDASKM